MPDAGRDSPRFAIESTRQESVRTMCAAVHRSDDLVESLLSQPREPRVYQRSSDRRIVDALEVAQLPERAPVSTHQPRIDQRCYSAGDLAVCLAEEQLHSSIS